MSEKIDGKENEIPRPDLILFGPPGSGKGIQGCKLAEKYGYEMVIMGDRFRKHIKEMTPLGQKVKACVARGDLVQNETVYQIFHELYDEVSPKSPIIFDGFPRDKEQLKHFEKFMAEQGRVFEVAALTTYKNETERLVQRIVNRAKKSKRKDDADESVIRNRQVVYKKESKPILKAWEKNGKKVHEHSAIGEIEKINKWLREIVEGALFQ